jgi:hypothetical protein
MAVAQRIPIVDVRASSSFFDNFQTIVASDSGLVEDPPGSGNFRLPTNALMWTSNYGTPNDENPLIHFEFDRVRTVERFRVWNYNEVGFNFRGFRVVTIQHSNDGQRWTTIPKRFTFEQGPGRDDYFGQAIVLPYPVAAKFVRFSCDSNYRFGGNPDVSGLGRVRFFEGGTPGNPGPETGPYPRATWYVNVKDAPYNAVGDGMTDDSAAIQRAINDTQGTGRVLYLPPGTYLLGTPLRYRSNSSSDRNSFFGFSIFQGAGSDETVLRLRDNTLTDPNRPVPVLDNGLISFFNGQFEESLADWFYNHFSGFTIDIGNGNPGAKGLQFFSNNTGSVQDVVVRSEDGQGQVAFEFGHVDKNGPFLAKDLRAEGFDIGVRTAQTVNSTTLENIVLIGQNRIAFLNEGQCLAIRGLSVTGRVPGLRSSFGHVAIVDSSFEGDEGAEDESAIINGEYLYARNVSVDGYRIGIENLFGNGGNVPESVTRDYVSQGPILTLFDVPRRSLRLPVESAPIVPDDPAETWANVRDFRLTTERDDSAALQRAIDSGATTVYWPSDVIVDLFADATVRGAVKRILGMSSQFRMWNSARIKVAEGTASSVEAKWFRTATFEQAGLRPVVLLSSEASLFSSNRGRVFLEDVVGDFGFVSGQRVWARQLNAEREGTKITNAGARLWILGLKTERGGTLVETTAGGATEVIGGLCYTTTAGRLAPMFTVRDAQLSVSLGEVCYTGDPFTSLVLETRNGVTRELVRGQAPFRFSFMQGSSLPLFRAGGSLRGRIGPSE